MAYHPIQLVTTEEATAKPIVANPIVDCRDYKWTRTDGSEIALLLNDSGTKSLVLPQMEFVFGFETTNHIIVSFSRDGQNLLEEAQVVILSKHQCVRYPPAESGLGPWDQNYILPKYTSNGSWAIDSIDSKVGGFWMKTSKDEIAIAYGKFGDLWDIDVTFTEDDVDFQSRTLVDDKTLLYNGIVMILDTDKERFSRVETTQSWRDKRTMAYEPYKEDST